MFFERTGLLAPDGFCDMLETGASCDLTPGFALVFPAF